MAGAQSDVLVRMTANEAQAVQGFRNLLTSQQRTEKQTRRMNRTMQQTGRTIDSLGRMARGVGAALGIGGLSAVARQLGQAFEQQNRKAREFEGSLRSVIAVGDNVGRIGEIREEVASMMETWALSGEQATAVMATMDDRAGALESRFRENLEPTVLRFSRLMDLDANQTLNTSISLMNVFGQELESTSHLLDMLKFTADAGAVSVEDLGGRVREMAPALEGMGLSLQEFLGAIAAASERGMEANTVTRGMEALVGALAEMRREGELTGDTLPDMLAEIGQRGEELDEILPRAALRVARALMDGGEASAALRDNLREMENIDGLRFQRQEAERLSDAMQLMADFAGRTERMAETRPARVGEGARHFGIRVHRATEIFDDAVQQIGLPSMPRFSRMFGFLDAAIGSPMLRNQLEERMREMQERTGQAPPPEMFMDWMLAGGGGVATPSQVPGGVSRGMWGPHARSTWDWGDARAAATGAAGGLAEGIEEEQDRRGQERERARIEEQELAELRAIRELLSEQHHQRLEAWHSLPPTQRMAREPSMRIERGRNAHGE